MVSNLKLLPLIFLPIALLISSGTADTVVILSVIIFLFYSIKNKNFYWIKDKYFVLLLIFYIYLLINFYFSQSREESLGRAFGFIRFPLFIMSIKYFFLKDFSKINLVIRFWTITVVIVMIDTLIQFFYGKNILGYPVLMMGNLTRLSSFLGKEYKIGGYLLIFSFIIVTYFLSNLSNRNLYKKILIFLFYLLSLTTIFLTGERSNFIIFCLCSFFFIIFSDFKIKFKIYLLTALLTISFFILSSVPVLKNRLINESLDIIKSKHLSVKDSILQTHYGAHYITAYQIFRDFPLVGSGIKTFRVACENKKYENYNIPWIKYRCTTHPHNVILEFLSELGIFGSFLFLIFFSYLLFIRIIYFMKNKSNFLLGLITCTALFYLPIIPRGSFFTNWNAVMFWTIVSLLISFINFKKNKS